MMESSGGALEDGDMAVMKSMGVYGGDVRQVIE